MLEDGFDLLVLLSQDNMTKSDVREHPAEAKKQERECTRLARPLDLEVDVPAS
jgi:hypothetical protein